MCKYSKRMIAILHLSILNSGTLSIMFGFGALGTWYNYLWTS